MNHETYCDTPINPIGASNVNSSKNSLAKAHDLAVLEIVARAGWLRSSDISRAIWGWDSDGQMARRILARLANRGMVDSEKVRGRTHVFGITTLGTRYLNSEIDSSYKPTVRQIKKIKNFEHRCLANLAAIKYFGDPDAVVYFEYEIQQGKLPLIDPPNFMNKYKIPDYFVVHQHHGCIWGEIERSKRNKKDEEFLINWLISVSCYAPKGYLPQIGRGMFLRQIEFFAGSGFEEKLQSRLEREFLRREMADFDAHWAAHDLVNYWTSVAPIESLTCHLRQ